MSNIQHNAKASSRSCNRANSCTPTKKKVLSSKNHYMAGADVKDVKPAQSAEPLVQTSELAHLTTNV